MAQQVEKRAPLGGFGGALFAPPMNRAGGKRSAR